MAIKILKNGAKKYWKHPAKVGGTGIVYLYISFSYMAECDSESLSESSLPPINLLLLLWCQWNLIVMIVALI